jgi:UDP-N-acetylmuramate--alanine ligase
VFLGRRRIHFVGVGGIGMSGIAEVLSNLGYDVSGSDLREGATIQRLRALGVDVAIGHSRQNVHGCSVVVRSSAVGSENPEVAEARLLGIPVIPRAEMLAELMRMKHGLAVAGTHGKTTTTSLLAGIFDEAGYDPTIVVGGKLNSVGTNAVLGRGEWMVAEADESDGSFLHLSPTVAIVTNIDPEHLDHYGSVAALHDAFLTFINKVPFYGAAVLCLDHPVIQDLIPAVTKRYVTYGFSSQVDLRATDVRIGDGVSHFDVHRGEKLLGSVSIQLPGRHNVLNSLAAIAAAMEAGIPFGVVQTAIGRFAGVQRRFSVRGLVQGVTVVDDYAHHPAEIQACLGAARESYGRRILAVWQPHRYSRVRDLHSEFMRAFNDCARVFVMDVYAAGEQPLAGIDGATLAGELRQHGHKGVVYAPDREAVLRTIEREARKGDIVITLGAGDVTQLSYDITDMLDGFAPPTLEFD